MPFQSLTMPGVGDLFLDPKYYLELSEAWNGYGSAPMGLTGINDDVYAAATLRNRGLGAALLAQDTAGTTDLLMVDDLGTTLTNLFGSGTAAIDGGATFGDTVDVSGGATFGDTVDVAGDGTFGSNVEIVGDLLVGGNVQIDGEVVLSGPVTLEDTLDVAGAATFATTLAVTGTAAFAAPATFATGLVTTAGGITFTGSVPGQRIVADFTSPTVANRTLAQTSTVNGLTDVGALPNGSGAGAAFSAYSAVNTAATARLVLYAAPAGHYLISAHTGAAYLPLEINVGGLAGMTFAANGDVTLGSAGVQLAFFGGGGAPIQTVEAEATDLASAIDLANSLRDIVLAYTLAET